MSKKLINDSFKINRSNYSLLFEKYKNEYLMNRKKNEIMGSFFGYEKCREYKSLSVNDLNERHNLYGQYEVSKFTDCVIVFYFDTLCL